MNAVARKDAGQRKYQRFSTFEGVKLTTQISPNNKSWYQVELLDISRQGMGISASLSLFEGKQVEFKLEARVTSKEEGEQTFSFQTTASIIWVKQERAGQILIHYGCHFLNINNQAARQLIGFTRALYKQDQAKNKGTKFFLFKKKKDRISSRLNMPMVIYLNKVSEPESKITGRLLDISLHGIGFGCNEKIAPDSEITFTMQASLKDKNKKSHSFKFTAQVMIRWTQPAPKDHQAQFLMGAEIIEIDQANHKVHMQLIDCLEESNHSK